MSSEIETVVDALRALLDGELLERETLQLVEALLERNALFKSRARGLALTLLEREAALLEEVKRILNAAVEHEEDSGTTQRIGGLTVLEISSNYGDEELGALKKGDIVATTKERAERLVRNGVARVVTS